MVKLRRIDYGKYTFFYPEGTAIDTKSLLKHKKDGRLVKGKGRSGIRIVSINNKSIVSREYVHGGILRGITRDFFFSEKRAIDELEIMVYLKERGFPVAEPYCVVIENGFLRKHLYIFTFYEEKAMSFPEYIRSVGCKLRLKAVKKLAYSIYILTSLNIYHPDLHLDNVLITENGEMKFLDFDKAYLKDLKIEDIERMFWRLNRYAEKLKKKGALPVGVLEKTLFLKTYERLSHTRILKKMEKKVWIKTIFTKVGWFFENRLYR